MKRSQVSTTSDERERERERERLRLIQLTRLFTGLSNPPRNGIYGRPLYGREREKKEGECTASAVMTRRRLMPFASLVSSDNICSGRRELWHLSPPLNED